MSENVQTEAVEPSNEVQNLFSNNNTENNNALAEMQRAEKEQSNDDAGSTQDEQEATQQHSEMAEKAEANNEKENKEEDYKPEEYQHNKNYKQAMEEARREKAEVKKQAQALREENEKMRKAFERIVEAQQQQEAPKIPTFEEDPLESLRHEAQQAKKELEALKTDKANERQYLEQQHAMQQFKAAWQQKAQEYAETNPDFSDAYNYALTSRMKEYEAVGYSKQEAMNLANEDEVAIVAKAFQNDINPAERIYELAKMRGYQRKESAPVTNNKQKFDTLEKGVKASKSIASGGVSTPSKLTLEDVASMSDEEFSKFDWNKLSKVIS